MIKFYSKRNCGACTLVRDRLKQFGVKYTEIFDHGYSAPMLEYRGRYLRAPITTAQLRNYLVSINVLRG